MTIYAFVQSVRQKARPAMFIVLAVLLCLTVLIEWLLFSQVLPGWVGYGLLLTLVLLALASGVAFQPQIAEPKLTQAEHRKAVVSLADFATDMFWETDLYGFIKDAGGRLMPKIIDDPSDLIGQHYLSIIQIDEREMRRMQVALNRQQPYSDIQGVYVGKDAQKYFISLSGTPRYDQGGHITGYLGVGTDVTARVMNARKLKHIAEHDMLTGLANRYRFSSRIKTDLRASRDDNCLCLLAIDLDGFKTVNDTLGHQAGDALLNLVGKRLRSHVREQDWAARMGGDEFVVVSRGVANPMEACLLAARLSAKLAQPYRIGGEDITATASIGIACAPLHANDADTLMKYADLALYQAKADGRNCYRLYEAIEKQLSPET